MLGGERMALDDNIALAQRYQTEMWGAGSIEAALAAADAIISPVFVNHSGLPWLSPDHEGLKEQLRLFYGAFPDIYSRIEDVVAEGDTVLIRWTGGATNTGEIFGIPPVNGPVTVNGMDWIRIDDGKIVEHWSNSDDLDLMRQLGVVPPLTEQE
jgi:predicted ester cyclase